MLVLPSSRPPSPFRSCWVPLLLPFAVNVGMSVAARLPTTPAELVRVPTNDPIRSTNASLVPAVVPEIVATACRLITCPTLVTLAVVAFEPATRRPTVIVQ